MADVKAVSFESGYITITTDTGPPTRYPIKDVVATMDILNRASMIEDALAIYGMPITSIRAADGAGLGLSETAGDHFISLSSDVWLLQGEEAISETEASVSRFQFVLPPEYVSAGDVKLRLKHRCNGAGTKGTATVDVSAYEQTGNGAKGSELVTTAPTATLKTTWTTTDFVLTAAGLVAGDILNFVVTSSIQESAGNALAAQIDGIAVLLDVKG